MTTKNRLPLLIVGHGTRSAAGVAQFTAFVERVRRRGADRVSGVGRVHRALPPP